MSVWVIMDTVAVRNTIQSDPRQVRLDDLHREKPDIRTSIAGSAVAELIEQLVDGDGGMDFSLWTANVGNFDGILDEEFPIFPSGRQLTALTGIEQIDEDLAEESRLVQACWRLLRRAGSVADLEGGDERVLLRGQQVEVRLSTGRLRMTVAGKRDNWIGYVESFRGRVGERPNRQAVLAEVRRRHGIEPTDAPDQQQRLAPVFEMITTLVHSFLRPRNGYNPTTDKRRGDTFDMNLLYVLAHPRTVIVTADGSFVNRLRETGVAQARRVLTIEELNEHLAAGDLETLVE